MALWRKANSKESIFKSQTGCFILIRANTEHSSSGIVPYSLIVFGCGMFLFEPRMLHSSLFGLILSLSHTDTDQLVMLSLHLILLLIVVTPVSLTQHLHLVVGN